MYIYIMILVRLTVDFSPKLFFSLHSLQRVHGE